MSPNVAPPSTQTPENVLSGRDAASMTDVDEIAVERAVRGDRTVHLNRAEVFAAFIALSAAGESLVRIAAILGVSDRAVSRWRRGVFPKSRRGVGTTIPWSPPPARPRVRTARQCPDCGASVSDSHIARHRRRKHLEVST